MRDATDATHATAMTAGRRPAVLPAARGARLAWRELGAPQGDCWLVLHGGPGGAAHDGLAAPLDLARQRAILADQRGAGASRPRGRRAGNHLAQLVDDLERLRVALGIERWSLLAGSWGTVLALAYAQRHPARVERLVLRAAFRASRRELDGLLRLRRGRDDALRHPSWPSVRAMALPLALRRLAQVLQAGTGAVAARRIARRWDALEQRSALRGLWRSALHAAGAGQADAGRLRQAWAASHRQWRRSLAALPAPRRSRADRARAQKFGIQCHYLLHRCFLRGGSLDAAVHSLASQHIPSDWVHGRYDSVCPEGNSWRWVAQLEAARPGLARLHRPASGHLSGEPRMREALAQVLRAERGRR